MGVDCRIVLPPQVRFDDVKTTLGMLLGLPHSRADLGRGSWALEVERMWEAPTGVLGMPYIKWQGAPGIIRDGIVSYHFEGSNAGERLLMPRSYPEWNALGVGLVTFFGGRVDFCDCDDVDIDFERPARFELWPDDGEPWRKLQEDMEAVKPLTPADVMPYRKFAAYGQTEDDEVTA